MDADEEIPMNRAIFDEAGSTFDRKKRKDGELYPAPDWVGSSAKGARSLSPAQRAGLAIEPFVPRPEGTRFRDGLSPFGTDSFVARITAAPRVGTRSSMLDTTHGIESPTNPWSRPFRPLDA